MLKLALGLVVVATFLAGCGEKIESLCKSSGGQCCAIAYSTNSDGSPKPSVFSCRKTVESCPELAKDGGTVLYPYTPDIGSERGKCEMKIKYGWAWETTLAKTARVHTISLAELLLAKPPTTVTLQSGRVLKASDPAYCKAVCSLGDAGLCPTIPVANTLSVGVLSLAVDLAEKPVQSSTVIPIEQVLQRFGVPVSANLCERDDVAASPTSFKNSGQADCRADIGVSLNGGKIDAEVKLPDLLAGKPLVADKLATFDPSTATSLAVSDPALQRYAGPITVAGRRVPTHLTSQIASADPACVELLPVDELEHPVQAIASFAASHPQAVTKASVKLGTFQKSVEKAAKLTINVSPPRAGAPVLFPNTAALLAANRLASQKGLPTFVDDVLGKAEGVSVTSIDMIYLMDVALCADLSEDLSVADMMRMLPAPKPEDANVTADRERMAGDILQCKFGSEYLTTTQRTFLRKFYSVASR